MGKMNKIPLEERLRKAGRDSSGCSAVFPLQLETYFYSWDRLLGGSRFAEMYRQEILSYFSFFGEACNVSEAVALLPPFEEIEQLELLAGILVEPFAAWSEKNREEENERRDRHEPENNNARNCERN